MSVNKVILLGHTGKAPDFKEFDNGGCVATFPLATTKRGFTTKDGRQIRSVPSGTTLCCKMGWQRSPISTSKRAINFILRGN